MKYPRFFRIAIRDRALRNKMELKSEFLAHNGEDIPPKVKLRLPNGHETIVRFNKEEGALYGVRRFFAKLPMEDEMFTFFTYAGSGEFLVHVLNDKFTEIDYGSPTEGSNGLVYPQDNVNGIGWKFLAICICPQACDAGIVRVPPVFLTRFGQLIPPQVRITLPNGQVFTASYSLSERCISGLRIFLLFDVMLFTYHGNGQFDMVLYSSSTVEKSYSLYNLHTGAMVGITPYQFKIEIQPTHLYKYCYGIDIHADYKAVLDSMSPNALIKAHYEEKFWYLQMRKTGRRTKIHGGWIAFSEALGLSVGDVLVFDKLRDRPEFIVSVYSYANRH